MDNTLKETFDKLTDAAKADVKDRVMTMCEMSEATFYRRLSLNSFSPLEEVFIKEALARHIAQQVKQLEKSISKPYKRKRA